MCGSTWTLSSVIVFVLGFLVVALFSLSPILEEEHNGDNDNNSKDSSCEIPDSACRITYKEFKIERNVIAIPKRMK